MKRDAAQTIFRTVVFAGAMLGSACGKKPAPANPTSPTATGTDPAGGEAAKPDPATATPAEAKPEGQVPADPNAGGDPCLGGERPRGTDEDGGGGTGRGFVLS